MYKTFYKKLLNITYNNILYFFSLIHLNLIRVSSKRQINVYNLYIKFYTKIKQNY